MSMMRAIFTFSLFLLTVAHAALVGADAVVGDSDLRDTEIALFESNHRQDLQQPSTGRKSALVVSTQNGKGLATDELRREFHELNLTFARPSRENYHQNTARAPFGFYPGTAYNYTHATCYSDLITPGVYILRDVQYQMPNASVTVCLAYCLYNSSTPYNYAGVEESLCSCGNTIDSLAGARESGVGNCTTPCVDPSSSYSCGGSSAGNKYVVIYTLTAAVPSFSTGDSQYQLFNGLNSCFFTNNVKELSVDGTVYTGLNNMVVEDCLDLCFKAGYGYAGIAGTVCTCSPFNPNHGGFGSIQAPRSCENLCPGNPFQYCGSLMNATANNATANLIIYQAITITVQASSVYDYIGCYSDTQANLLPGGNIAVGNIADCISACQGNSSLYAAIGFGFGCWCGNSLNYNGGLNALQADNSQCNIPCAQSLTESCGGWLYLDVYSTTIPTTNPGDSNYTLSGCYSDADRNGNILLSDISRAMSPATVKTCLAFCAQTAGRPYKYAGVESQNQCYCGNTINGGAGLLQGSLLRCSELCGDNQTEYCGGQNYADVYVYNNWQPWPTSIAPSSTRLSSKSSTITIILSSTSPKPSSSYSIQLSVTTSSYSSSSTTLHGSSSESKSSSKGLPSSSSTRSSTSFLLTITDHSSTPASSNLPHSTSRPDTSSASKSSSKGLSSSYSTKSPEASSTHISSPSRSPSESSSLNQPPSTSLENRSSSSPVEKSSSYHSSAVPQM